MRILKRLQAACLLFILAGLVFGQEQPVPELSPPELPPALSEALKRAEIPPLAVGLYVQEVGGGPMMLAANLDRPFAPASTMKLLTSDAALELLGPAYTWKTQAFADGVQAGDTLRGNLVIKGSGDPKLVVENLWLFLRRVRESGIRRIKGNLVLDRSAFEEVAFDAASFDGYPMRPYNAGPDALLLNYKTLSFRFIPDEATRRVRVTVDPPLAGYAIKPPRLGRGECGEWRGKLEPTIDARGARFKGRFAASCGERAWHIHPDEMSHTQYFGAVFRRLWAELGGSFKGEVRNGVVPPNARLIAEWESEPLAEVIRDINKFSNNVMARQLLLTLGHDALQMPATAERGAAVIQLWLAKKGIAAPELSIENGSGLSRTDRISALTLGRLLAAAYQSPTMPEFISSLPMAGIDGTMRRRLTMQSVAGNAHIKTGSLDEVRAVAGYVQAASGKRYVVVCLINHPNADRGQEVQDALLEWVYEHG